MTVSTYLERSTGPYQLATLQLHQYREFAPGTLLRFHDNVNVFLGKNATGKTALLHLISMIARSDFSALRGETFDLSYTLKNPELQVTVRVTCSTDTEPAVAQEGAPPSRTESFRVRVHRVSGIPAEECVILGRPDALRLGQGDDAPRVTPGISVFDHGFLNVGLRRLHTALPEWLVDSDRRLLEPAYSTFRFDEGLLAFSAMLGELENGQERGSPCNMLLAFTSRGDTIEGDYFPPLLAFHVASKFTASTDAPVPSIFEIDGHEVDYLAKFLDLTGFTGAQLGFILGDAGPSGDRLLYKVRQTHLMFSIGKRKRIGHDLLSYGQKRLLTFLYHAAVNKNFIIADELINGFHHRWIECCVELLAHKQSFLTSQNPLLLDFLPIHSAAQVGEMFIQCHRSEDGALSARNLSEQDADEFFRDLEAGIQHTGEILRIRGLW